MFMQAWGNYGTAWPVVHQQLGVRPDLGHGRLEIVPQVPAGQPRVQGENIRLGGGSADVLATHAGRRYTTTVEASSGPRCACCGSGTRCRRLDVGHASWLDGKPGAEYQVRTRPTAASR